MGFVVDSQDAAESAFAEVRRIIRQDLVDRLTAGGLNAADIEVTLKALEAQLELLEQALSNQRPA